MRPSRDTRGSAAIPSPRGNGCALVAVTAAVVAVVAIETRLATLAFGLAGLPPLAAILMLLGEPRRQRGRHPGGPQRDPTGSHGGSARSPVGNHLLPPAAGATPDRDSGQRRRSVDPGRRLGVPAGPWTPLDRRSGAAALTAIAVHVVARAVPGVGITVPTWVPAVTSALAAFLSSPTGNTAAVAYVAGVLGTLVGADLTHLDRIRKLGVDRVSIGGAGTFDGVFLSGIFAVLLATVM